MPLYSAFPSASTPIANSDEGFLNLLPGLKIFPSLLGEAFPIKRTVMWRTRKAVAIGGKQTTRADWPYPRYLWTLQFSVLRQGAVGGQVLAEMQELYEFFQAHSGGFASFLYQDQDDNAITNQVIGVGDGSRLNFPLVRAFGGSVERVLQAVPGTLTISFDGVDLPGSFYTVTQAGTTDDVGPGVIKFLNPPSAGVTIRGTFQYYWLVRFNQDACQFEEFLLGYHRVNELAFRSLLL